MAMDQSRALSGWTTILRWFDTDAGPQGSSDTNDTRVDWLRTIPFISLHLAALGVFWVGWSAVAVFTAIALYGLRMFAITGFYHRYFSHRSFRTSRALQFVFALIGASAVQRGPLWWAANHRIHHAHADTPEDVHSPLHYGFLWSHMCWFLARRHFRTRLDRIRDFASFPELRLLDRFDVVVPILFGVGMFWLGECVAGLWPALGTNGWQMLVWGFVVSTLVVYHATFTITSLAHQFGRRRYDTPDGSRNNFALALLTFGEGWHNNHHFYPASARQGFRWWEVDLTYYILCVFRGLGLIWDIRPVPSRVLTPQPAGSPKTSTLSKAV